MSEEPEAVAFLGLSYNGGGGNGRDPLTTEGEEGEYPVFFMSLIREKSMTSSCKDAREQAVSSSFGCCKNTVERISERNPSMNYIV